VLPRRARLFSTIAVLTVAAVNAAGLWSIAASRRAVADEAARLFRLGTETRARALEGVLTGTRSDLEFLAGSPLVTRILAGGAGAGDPEQSARRDATESALLLFLRAHPEVTRLAVRAESGEPLVLVGRRGGVPILWVASNPTGGEGPAMAPDRPRLATLVAPLEAEIAPSLLLTDREGGGASPGGGEPSCVLADGTGRVMARRESEVGDHPLQPQAHDGGRGLQASADVAVAGWTSASPWRLRCAQSAEAATAFVEPVAARYRTTLALNLGAMSLAVLLGLLAAREVAQRERLEARAREETHVRDLERQLFHAERLTTAGRLAAGIAHEINNPLEGMANNLSLARGALERGDVQSARRRLDSVRQGLDRAALVVRQVLAHADPAKAPRTAVDINRVLAESTEFVRSRPEFAGVRFESALAEAPLTVEGNPIMLGQVALNLIVNACEAQPGGGVVRVSAQAAGSQVLAEVADRGPGISAADRERIFEPFFSTKNSTGLGLSICHSIVQQHGGRLEARPRPGGGTVFQMTLPLSPARTEVA
jgi:signal transduction histidine kinase